MKGTPRGEQARQGVAGRGVGAASDRCGPKMSLEGFDHLL
jgi:hypothetical protein